MKAGIIQRIFLEHYAKIDSTRSLSSGMRWAARNIMTCRTSEQGYHIDECPNGDHRVLHFNSCKHRSCPLCGATETELWIERQCAKELHTAHHHSVFTVPHLLHPLWRWNRKLFTNLMFLAAWHSLRELLGDKKWLGALPGVTAVFQSWSDELAEHVHLHLIITCGGLDQNGKWIAANEEYLLPVPVLAAKFRGKFLAYLRDAFNPETPSGKQKTKSALLVPPPDSTQQKCLNLFNRLGRTNWHVQIEPAYTQAKGAIKYTGRYIRRGPLSEKRVVAYDGQSVTIAYAHPEKHEQNIFRLQAKELIQRLLSHVPEKGTHCARVYGLYHSSNRDRLNLARSQLNQPPYVPEAEIPDTHELIHRMFPDFIADLCPKCRARLRTVKVYRPGHAPPCRSAA